MGACWGHFVVRFSLGFVKPSAPAAPVWNPADKSSNITLSNGNRTATLSSVGFCSVRATSSKSSGKWFFEAVYGTTNGVLIGLSSSALNVTNQYAGQIANSVGYQQSGDVFIGDSKVASYSTYTTGAAIGVAIDFSAGKVWFGLNGSWNGDPATNSGGISFSPSAAMFPTFSPANTGISSTLRVPTSFTVPSGFTAWQ